MKKKILTGLGALVFLTALIFNVSIAKDNNSLVLDKMGTIAVAYDEDTSEGGNNGGGNDTYPCSAGGPGAASCKAGFDWGGGVGTSCEVSCFSGYYACCNNYYNKCQCRKNS